MKKNNRNCKSGMTLLELVAALALFILVINSFTSISICINKAERHFEDENRALIVMGNTVERLAAAGELTKSQVFTILKDEYMKSSLNNRKDMGCDCLLEDDVIRMTIIRKGKVIALVELKP